MSEQGQHFDSDFDDFDLLDGVTPPECICPELGDSAYDPEPHGTDGCHCTCPDCTDCSS